MNTSKKFLFFDSAQKSKLWRISDKKGISEIVAYVLLIVIAVSLSLLVYAWLKGYLPKTSKTCPDSVSISIDDYSCENGKINLTLKNTGYFYIEGFIARISNTTKAKATYFLKNQGSIESYFINEKKTLTPDEKYTISFDYSQYGAITRIEIEPFKIDKDVILCENSIIKQEIKNCGGGVNCNPSCSGVCGSDGCGGFCQGPCPSGQTCSQGVCQNCGNHCPCAADGDCESGYFCANNYCTNCSDSDGGINYNIKGTTRYYDGIAINTVTDLCVNSNTLKEFYCQDNTIQNINYNCLCIDGRCTGTVPDCTDSDGGRNYFINGTTCVGSDCLTDSCSSNVLTEYYCSGSTRNSETVTCQAGCGANNDACDVVIGGPCLGVIDDCRYADQGDCISHSNCHWDGSGCVVNLLCEWALNTEERCHSRSICNYNGCYNCELQWWHPGLPTDPDILRCIETGKTCIPPA